MASFCKGGNEPPGSLKVNYLFTIEREKFYPGPGPEPEPLALRASALTTELSRTSTDPW